LARKFITTRELGLVDSWTRELVQDIVQQSIIYYAISVDESDVHPVYEEAVVKEFLTPIRINARVEFTQLAAKAEGSTLDSTYGLDVELHSDECRQRNLVPREGNFVEFGQVVFEITSVGHAQPTFGQINDKLAYKLTCVPSRQGQFQVDNSAIDGIDNTIPIEPAKPRTLGDDL
jgi:hypothetical protein